MSEDDIRLFSIPDKRWRLSGHDVDIIADLQEVVRHWIPALSETEDIALVVDLLRDLDGITNGVAPSNNYSFEMKRIDPKRGGISVEISFDAEALSLSCHEWVPNVNGTLDYGAIYGMEGLPISMTFDRMGSYEREIFDEWWHIALDCGPQEPRDQNIKCQIEITL